MNTKDQLRSGFAAEIKVIPSWAWVLAALAFIVAQLFFNVAILYQGDAPPLWARPILGTMAGLMLGCYLLFIGYVARDSQRRGMNPFLWVLVAIFIPNGLGIILYFILRQRLSGVAPATLVATESPACVCPRCACALSHCPACGNTLNLAR